MYCPNRHKKVANTYIVIIDTNQLQMTKVEINNSGTQGLSLVRDNIIDESNFTKVSR